MTNFSTTLAGHGFRRLGALALLALMMGCLLALSPTSFAATSVAAWGFNDYGQLGDNSTKQSNVPVAINSFGVLSGKTFTQVAAGRFHSLALCSDGTLAAWGDNSKGELGNNSTTQSNVPVAVVRSGVLSGKTITQISAGAYHSLALCSDGTLAAWGDNSFGQLGNNSLTTQSNVPVAVVRSGVLSGKTITQISAGYHHSLALCSDGTLAAWGRNYEGELGNDSTSDSYVPVVINSFALRNKTVTQIAAGNFHSLALCSDGTLAAWGDNKNGQLGNSLTTQSNVPVAVVRSGVLSGKTITQISAGTHHSLALCSDSTLAAWGGNFSGELGNGGTTDSSVPVAVVRSGDLSGKIVTQIAAGFFHNLALCSDGTLVAWGYNYYGELGTNSGPSADRRVPVAVLKSGGLSGKTVTQIAAGSFHSLALAIVTPITVGIGSASTIEGNSGTTTLNFPLTLSTASTDNITVTYSTSNGTATAGSDYVGVTNGTATIAAGQTTGTIPITINGDTTFEPDETFTVMLNGATGATVGTPASATGTIQNDDIETGPLIVNTLIDDSTNGDDLTSLREAITYANSLASNDTITFSVTGTIRLLSTLPSIVTTSTAGTLTINGPSGGITISGDANGNNTNDSGDVQLLLVNNGANLSISGLTLSGGRTTYLGGAIYNYGGTVSITNSTLSGNTSSAIFINGGTVIITNSTLSGNTTNDAGGAIYINGGTVTLKNSTLSSNTALGVGAAIFINSGIVSITNSTLSGNTTPSAGGAIYNYSGTLTLKNSLAVGNNPPDNVYGTLATGSTNNITSGTATAAGLDPAGLKNNGGPTQTIALVAGGAAIDAGDNALIPSGVTTDQRGTGFARIIGGKVDIGAYETEMPPFSVSVTLNTTSPKTLDLLTATPTNSKGATLTYSYLWKKNGSVIPGQTTQNFDLSVPANGDKGDVISVQVTGTDGQRSTPATASATVINSAPVGGLLTSTWLGRQIINRPDVADADNDPLTFTLVPGSASGGVVNGLDGNDGLFLFTPGGSPGFASFGVSVSDGTATSIAPVQIAIGLPPATGTKIYTSLGANDNNAQGASDFAHGYTALINGKINVYARGYPTYALSNRGFNKCTVFDLSRKVGAVDGMGGTSIIDLVMAENPAVITLWFGPNEALGYAIANPYASGFDADNFAYGFVIQLNGVLRSLQPTGAAIAVANVPKLGQMPIAFAVGLNEEQRTNLTTLSQKISEQINSLAGALNVPVVDLFNDSSATDISRISSDGFHPNDAGYAALADKFFNALRPLLPLPSPSSGAIISEYRLSGPGGDRDEFIEIYNQGVAPLDLAGWSVGTASTRLTIPSGKTIPPYARLLITGSAYSLKDYGGTDKATGDIPNAFSADLPTGSSLELRNALGAVVDSVSAAGLPSPLAASDDYSYVRRMDGAGGAPLDTGSDAGDFNLVDVSSSVGPGNTTGISGGLLRLGAPGPENLSSPIAANQLIKWTQTGFTRTGTGNSGTLIVRGTVQNGSSRAITALRFHMVGMTAGTTNPANTAPADIRLSSSSSSDGINLPLVLQNPPTQPNGGGLNSSVSLGGLPGGGLAPNATVSVEFVFSIAKTGTFRFLFNAEPVTAP